MNRYYNRLLCTPLFAVPLAHLHDLRHATNRTLVDIWRNRLLAQCVCVQQQLQQQRVLQNYVPTQQTELYDVVACTV